MPSLPKYVCPRTPKLYPNLTEVLFSRETTYILIRQPSSKSGKFTCTNTELDALSTVGTSYQSKPGLVHQAGSQWKWARQGMVKPHQEPYHQGQMPK